MPKTTLSIGNIIKTERGMCAVTLLVQEKNSHKILALTDSYTIALTRGIFSSNPTAKKIGDFKNRQLLENRNDDLGAMYNLFRVREKVETDNNIIGLNFAISRAANSSEIFLSEPKIVLGNGETANCELIEFDVKVNLEDSDRTFKLESAIIASINTAEENIFGGAPIVDARSRKIIGGVVGKLSRGWVISPLQRLIEKNDLKILTPKPKIKPILVDIASSNLNSLQSKLKSKSEYRELSSPNERSGAIRIAGVQLPTHKRTIIALQYIHGIGASSARKIIEEIGIGEDSRLNQLTDVKIREIGDKIDKEFVVEGDLRQKTTAKIKRLIDLGCYRGLRHRCHLPVRGQRTHTNARTRKRSQKLVAKQYKK